MKNTPKQPKVKFYGFNCNLEIERYRNNNRIALTLSDDTTGEPVATCTVNLPEADLPEGYVFIKNYSENAPSGEDDMLTALIKAKIIEPPINNQEYIIRGCTNEIATPKCKLLIHT